MVALPEVKNVSDLNTSGGNVLIPEGVYPAMCINSEMRSNKSGTGQFIELTFAITGQEHNGTQLKEILNIINPSQKAVEIAYNTLGKISKALGLAQTPSDTVQIHNKPLMIEIKNKKGDAWVDNDGVQREGSERSEIKGYKPAQQAGGFSQAQAPAAAPMQPQPQQAAPQPAAAPAQSPFAL